MATVRSSRVSRARYTSPMPPAPRGATISYGPSLPPEETCIRAPEPGLFGCIGAVAGPGHRREYGDFSLINAVMLRSLPVREPERLVQITRLTPDGKPGVV